MSDKTTSDTPSVPTFRPIQCGAVWAGIQNHDDSIEIGAVRAAIYSRVYGEGREGGDLYYFSICNADALTRLAIADVVGHGEAVSRVSRTLFDSMQRHLDDANGATILSELNGTASEIGLSAMTTAAIVQYYRPTHTLAFAYAGHPAALIQRGGGAWEPAEVTPQGAPPRNLPLAVFDDTPYDQAELSLNPGDRVVVFTDGVPETPNAAGEELGTEGVIGLLTAAGPMGVTDLKSHLLNGLRAHHGGDLDHDDVTLLVLEVAADA